MNLLEIILLSFSLAADAFAVSICVGAAGNILDIRSMVRLSWHFGFFQFMMPVIGWCVGIWFAQWMHLVDRWAAFFLLAFVGFRMIRSAMYTEEIRVEKNPTKGSILVLLSFATSIDALAVGVSLGLAHISIWYPSVVIGIITGITSFLGIQLGEKFNRIFGRIAEASGGLILIGIGLKILLEHSA